MAIIFFAPIINRAHQMPKYSHDPEKKRFCPPHKWSYIIDNNMACDLCHKTPSEVIR